MQLREIYYSQSNDDTWVDLITRLNEHGTRDDQPMYRHLIDCNKFHEVASLFNLPHSIGLEEVDKDSFIHNAVINNAIILDTTRNWSQLEFLEAYYIKKLNPKINNGLKASKELQLFR